MQIRPPGLKAFFSFLTFSARERRSPRPPHHPNTSPAATAFSPSPIIHPPRFPHSSTRPRTKIKQPVRTLREIQLRCRAPPHRLLQHRPDRRMQPLQFTPIQSRTGPVRMHPGQVQRLVHINVPQSRNHRLIHQTHFHHLTRPSQPFLQRIHREPVLQWLRAQTLLRRLRFQCESSKPSRVHQTTPLIPQIQFNRHVAAKRRIDRLDHKATRHAQMSHSRPQHAVQTSPIKQQVFPAPTYPRADGPPHQVDQSFRRARTHHSRTMDMHPLHASFAQPRCKVPPQYFDLGKLWHDPTWTERTNPPMNSCPRFSPAPHGWITPRATLRPHPAGFVLLPIQQDRENHV